MDEEDPSAPEPPKREALKDEARGEERGARGEEGQQEGMEVDGEAVMTVTVERPPESYFHTLMDEGRVL